VCFHIASKPGRQGTMKLTKAVIAGLTCPLGKSEAVFWDDDIPGLAVRVLASGKASWTYQYRLGRKQGKITLGATSALTLADARATAAKLHARVRLGEDPQAEKAKARAAQDDTFGSIGAIYLRRKAEELRPRSMLELRRHLEVHARPLHKIALADLTRRNVSQLIAKLADASGNVAANRTGSSIAAFLAWAQREGIVENNVGANHNKLHEASRERVLSDDELRSIWRATDRGTDYHDVVRLLALTGARRAEIGGLRWGEVDLDRGLISLPPERCKNARAFELPLSAAAAAILKARRRDGDRVFEGFSGFSSCKLALDARAKIAPWTLHDLRRTVSTIMNGQLGLSPHIVEACLGHVGARRGVAGIYNKATYLAEKRQAMLLWGEYIGAIVEGSERHVLPFAARPQ
jgi:integrase